MHQPERTLPVCGTNIHVEPHLCRAVCVEPLFGNPAASWDIFRGMHARFQLHKFRVWVVPVEVTHTEYRQGLHSGLLVGRLHRKTQSDWHCLRRLCADFQLHDDSQWAVPVRSTIRHFGSRVHRVLRCWTRVRVGSTPTKYLEWGVLSNPQLYNTRAVSSRSTDHDYESTVPGVLQ